jgi:hypothetical protein
VNKYLNKRNRRKKLNTNNKNIIDAIKEEDTLRKYKKLFKEEKNYYNNVINKYNNYNYSNDNDKEDNKFIINNKSDIIGQKLMYA